MSRPGLTAGRARRLAPLVLATAATQASIVVLAPLLVEIGDSLGASVSAVGAARSVLAAVAFLGSLAVGPLIDRIGVRPLIVRGGLIAAAGAAITAVAPSLAVFYVAHAVTGVGVACLLSAGFAGVGAYFSGRELAWAMGYVIGAQSLSWIFGNPVVGLLAEVSWRFSYAVPLTICLAATAAGLTLARMPAGGRAARAAAGGAGGSANGATVADGAPGAVVPDPASPDPAVPDPASPDPASPPRPEPLRAGLRAVAADRSARRWTIAETVTYSAWTAELTYTAAFYIDRYGTSVSVVGLLLAGGSLVFLATSLNTARLTDRFPRKPLLVGAGVAMGALLIPILNWAPSPLGTFLMFCLVAFFASVRSTGSSALGLEQLPDRPGAMMGARTGAAQLGYVIGAAGGGAVLALWGFGALGFVLCGGMLVAAALLAGVHDPWSDRGRGGRAPVAAPPTPTEA